MSEQNTRNDFAGTDSPGDDDLCLDLLHDLLSPRQREELLARMTREPELEAKFKNMVATRERLRANRSWQVSSDSSSVRVSGSTARRRPTYQIAVSVLAAAAILVLIFLPQFRNKPGDLPVWPLPATGESLHFRAPGDEVIGEDLAAGLRAYDTGDYQQAVVLLQDARASGQLEAIRMIYLGSALTMRRSHQQAVAMLEPVSTSALPDPWGSEARWTLIVALRGTGRLASADSLLHVLASESGVVGDRARQTLGIPEHP